MFSILSWNANGLSPHKEELLRYLSKNKKKPDILCFQESHFNSKTQFNIPGYALFAKK